MNFIIIKLMWLVCKLLWEYFFRKILSFLKNEWDFRIVLFIRDFNYRYTL
jgi:hypothetical protein